MHPPPEQVVSRQPAEQRPDQRVDPEDGPERRWYWSRSRSRMTSAISAPDVPISALPPIPCTARDAISIILLLDRPQKNEPMMSTPTPSWNTR